jgi:hypothetical protein
VVRSCEHRDKSSADIKDEEFLSSRATNIFSRRTRLLALSALPTLNQVLSVRNITRDVVLLFINTFILKQGRTRFALVC